MVESLSVAVADAVLETYGWGSGEAVVFIQTALMADELLPIASDPALDGFRKVLYHRRGYAGSSPRAGPGSIARDAADCVGLLAQLGIDRAHLVGLSFSGAVALQLVRDAPGVAHTLTLIEPPPVHTPSAGEFRVANERLLETRRAHGHRAALDEFLELVIGPDWPQVVEERSPGSTVQMRADAPTFFDVDLPALLGWRFTAEDAARIECPVLYVGGTDSGPWFAEVHDLMREWLADVDDAIVDGADHAIALTHPREVAEAVGGFIASRPIGEHAM